MSTDYNGVNRARSLDRYEIHKSDSISSASGVSASRRLDAFPASQLLGSQPLEGPSTLYRRSSNYSIHSTVSDLSLPSGGDRNQNSLTRSLSHASTLSTTSTRVHRPWRQKFQDIYDDNYGALLVLMSQFFGSLMNVATRVLEHPGAHGAPMHPFQILFARQSITTVACIVYAVYTKSIPHFPLGPPDRSIRLLLVCRGLMGFFGVFGIYFSLLYLPLSEATVLTFLAPILTCYACSFLIPGQTFTKQQQIAGFVSLIGVVFIAQPFSLLSATAAANSPASAASVRSDQSVSPGLMTNDTTSVPPNNQIGDVPTSSQHLLAITIAMVGVIGATGAMTAIRAIGTRAHAFISMIYFSAWSTVVTLVALIVLPDVSFRFPANLTEWGLLLSLGASGFVLQILLTMGLAYGGPGIAAQRQGKTTVTNNVGDTNDIEMTPRVSSSVSGPSRTRHPTSASSGSKSSGTKATSMVYMQMLFALTFDRWVFGTVPSFWSWIGSGLILGGAIWVAIAKDGTNDANSQKDSAETVLVDGVATTNGPQLEGKPSDEEHTREESVGLLAGRSDDDTYEGSTEAHLRVDGDRGSPL